MGCPRYRGVFHRTACAVPLLIQRHSALCRRGHDLSRKWPPSALCRRGHDLRATQGDRSPVLTSSAARRMKKERGTKKLTVATRQRGSTRRESTTKNLVRQNHRTMILSYVKSFRGKRWRGAGDLGVNLEVLQTIKEGKRIYASAGQVRRQASGSCLASDFVVLVLSETVLSETVLVLDGCLNLGDADRRPKRFEVTCGPIRSFRVRVREYARTKWCTKVAAGTMTWELPSRSC